MTTATAIAPRLHRFSQAEYEAMIETGIFDEANVELVDGEVLEMAPQKSRHATSVRATEEVLRVAFGAGFDVRVQLPLAVGGSLPEPDVAVVAGSFRDYRDAHPTTAVLIVEIADTSLELDRGKKRALYARSGIADYWVLSLRDETLEVHRRPLGDRYREVRVFRRGDRVTPLGCSTAISVDELLP